MAPDHPLGPDGRPWYLVISAGEEPVRSRVGGNPPACFEEPRWAPLLNEHRYLLTLGDGFGLLTGGDELSVLVPEGDGYVYGDSARYPRMGVVCVRHPPSPVGSSAVGRIDGIGEGRLVPVHPSRVGEIPVYVKIGGTPDWVQGEPYYEEQLVADGYSFLLQIDESGYATDFIREFLWGFGALYIYGKWSADGLISEMVPGYFQF